MTTLRESWTVYFLWDAISSVFKNLCPWDEEVPRLLLNECGIKRVEQRRKLKKKKMIVAPENYSNFELLPYLES